VQDSQLLLCYYGDDFTGSTDVMESLALSGIRTVLFLCPPDPNWLNTRFSDIQCFGVAGVSRSMTPDQMEAELRPILARLKSFGTPIVHYKVCSTFDSSTEVGNIGRVIEVGLDTFPDSPVVPLLVGAPPLKRYTVFGQHFATMGEHTHRLDRHPIMSRHPVTPMHEADLRLLLQEQANLKVGLMDILDLDGEWERVISRFENRMQQEPDVLLFDVLDKPRLLTAGKLIWQQAKEGQLFAVGSSGVQYALTEYWNSEGLLSNPLASTLEVKPVSQTLVVSGSCSPVTKEQIEWAVKQGFMSIRVPVTSLMNPLSCEQTRDELRKQSLQAITAGRSLILYTALGPDDPIIGETKAAISDNQWQPSEANKALGMQLGKLIREIIEESDIRRLAISGGDTSSHATRELGLYALELSAPLDPGVPLCQAYSDHEKFDGLEIALKGGQMGQANFFGKVLGGI
jgi:3-oxoisoapionate kinase